jgi:hypothetical protein
MKITRSQSGLSGVTKTTYESDQFTISGAQSNYDVALNTGKPSKTSRSITIKAFSACTIKLNSTSNDAITFAAGEQQTISDLPVSNLYVTTTGDTIIRIISYR